jgi:hypothetical protein
MEDRLADTAVRLTQAGYPEHALRLLEATKKLRYKQFKVGPKDTLYHFSYNAYKNSILRKGLIPSKKTNDVPPIRFPEPRVYVAPHLEGLAGAIQGAFAVELPEPDWDKYDEKKHGSEWDYEQSFSGIVVFEINPSKLLKGTVFYEDPESWGMEAWTPSRIPPRAIKINRRLTDSDDWWAETSYAL